MLSAFIRSKLWKSFCATVALKLEKATEVRRVEAEEWARWREGPVRGGSIAVAQSLKSKSTARPDAGKGTQGTIWKVDIKCSFEVMPN